MRKYEMRKAANHIIFFNPQNMEEKEDTKQRERCVQSNAKRISNRRVGRKGYKAKKWKFFQVENHVKCNRQPLTAKRQEPAISR